MRKNHLLMLILTAFLVGSTFGSVGTASSTPLVSVNPKISMGSASTTIAINITVANITEARALYSYDINLTFNPAILNCTGVEEGPFLKQAGSTQWFPPTIRNDKGYVLFGSSLKWIMLPPPPGASGNGTLGTVTFDILAEGRSPLNFSQEGDVSSALYTLIEDEGWWYSDPIVHDRENGVFTILGDVNGSGTIDIYDVALIGEAYGKTQGDPDWDEHKVADMTGPGGVPDGAVDNYDLALCGTNYGNSA